MVVSNLAAVRKRGGDKKNVDIDAIGKKIRAAVQAGKMTKKENKARMAVLIERLCREDGGERQRCG